MASTCDTEVKPTAKAVFPFAMCVNILLMFPPGQAPTKIIPRATDGGGCKSFTKPKVSSGSKIKCADSPTKVVFLFFRSEIKSSFFSSREIPNRINPRMMLSIIKLFGLKLILIESISFMV